MAESSILYLLSWTLLDSLPHLFGSVAELGFHVRPCHLPMVRRPGRRLSHLSSHRDRSHCPLLNWSRIWSLHPTDLTSSSSSSSFAFIVAYCFPVVPDYEHLAFICVVTRCAITQAFLALKWSFGLSFNDLMYCAFPHCFLYRRKVGPAKTTLGTWTRILIKFYPWLYSKWSWTFKSVLILLISFCCGDAALSVQKVPPFPPFPSFSSYYRKAGYSLTSLS